MSSSITYFLSGEAEQGLTAAARAVADGECVVLPTDTVYGIGANAFSSEAVDKLLEAKQRGADMPPPVLIAEPSMLRAFTADVPQSARALAEAFWPGALTLILKVQKTLNLGLGETGGTVAVRVPDHEHARSLLRRTGPLAVSSANISGQPPATSCDQARRQLADAVMVYLDGGHTPGPTPSTIVDFTRFRGGQIVREGLLGHEQLKAVAKRLKPLESAAPAVEAPDEAAALEAPEDSTHEDGQPATEPATEPAGEPPGKDPESVG